MKLSQLYAATGDFENAVSELHKFIPVPGSFTPDAKGYRELGRAGFSQPEMMTWAATTSAVTGERDKAFDYLEKALADDEIELILCIRYPTLDSIRSGPRYSALMKQLGLPE
jgi:tetratricopeptide (TPR) repeat protein